MVHSHSEFHISVAYMSCWSPLSGPTPAAVEWEAQALEVRSVPAVSSPSCHAPSGWRVSSCPGGSGLNVTHGADKFVRVVATRHAAVGAPVAG